MSMLRRSQAPRASSTDLISVGELIKASWSDFRRDSNQTFRISLWLLVPALAVLAVGLLDRFVFASMGSVFGLLALIASACFEIWVQLRLMQRILPTEDEAYTLTDASWVAPTGSYLWLEILHRIALIGAALPIALGLIGLPVFILLSHLQERAVLPLVFVSLLVLGIPAIWLSMQLFFWPFILATHPDGVSSVLRSSGAVRFPSLKNSLSIFVASSQLVRGRFWATFVRLLVPGIVFGLLFLVVTGLLDTLFNILVGEAKMNLIFETIPQGYAYFLVTLGEVLFLPLFITWQAKLFHSLKQTRR